METQTAESLHERFRHLVNRTPPRWALLILLCAALVLRGRVMLSNVASMRADPDAYNEVAWRIHQSGTFGMWQDSTRSVQPIASRPPLYPLLLAALEFLHPTMDPHGYGLLHVILGTGTVWAVWRLGGLWGLPPGACILAAALVAVDPILLGQSIVLMTETLAAFLAAVALVAVTRAAGENSLRWSLTAGVLLGLCVLCRPVFAVWLVAILPMFARRASGDRRLLRAGVVLAGTAMVLAPWAIRNRQVFGQPIITTTHGGSTLLLANNPEFYEFLRSAPWGSTWDARHFNNAAANHLKMVEGDDVSAYDEVARDREAYRMAWEHIRGEPLMFAYACLVRVGRLWGVMPHATSPDESPSRRGLRYAIAIWYVLEFALAAAGAWLLGRKLGQAPWLWGTLLVLSLTAVHTLYWTDMRMRAPAVSVVALAAAYGAVVLATEKRAASPLPPKA